MNQTNRLRNCRPIRRLILGIGAATTVSAFLQAQLPAQRTPAVSVKLAVPVVTNLNLPPTDGTAARIVGFSAAAPSDLALARAAAPDFTGFNSTRSPAVFDPSNPPPLASSTTTNPAPLAKPASDPAKPSVLGNAWSNVKDFVVGKGKKPSGPNEPPPPKMPEYLEPAASIQVMPQQRFFVTSQPGVYAGPPSYRWYGWGTTTPGANPMAPGGLSPRGSANWYALTGATPGAFPVPTMNPYRPAPGSEPPAYVGGPPPSAIDLLPQTSYAQTPTVPTYSVRPNPPVQPEKVHTIPTVSAPSETVRPIPTFQTMPTLPSAPRVPETEKVKPSEATVVTPKSTAASAPTPPPAPRAFTPPPPKETPLEWQSSANKDENVPFSPAGSTPVERAKPKAEPTPMLETDWEKPKSPTAPESVLPKASNVVQVSHNASAWTDLRAVVEKACDGWASVTDWKTSGGNKIHIVLTAKSEVEARTAADEISRVPQLKNYEVTFEAKLAK